VKFFNRIWTHFWLDGRDRQIFLKKTISSKEVWNTVVTPGLLRPGLLHFANIEKNLKNTAKNTTKPGISPGNSPFFDIFCNIPGFTNIFGIYFFEFSFLHFLFMFDKIFVDQ